MVSTQCSWVSRLHDSGGDLLQRPTDVTSGLGPKVLVGLDKGQLSFPGKHPQATLGVLVGLLVLYSGCPSEERLAQK